jgi:hypothetical protein
VPELKIDQLLLIAGFILPGAISMYVYGLKVPQKEFELKDRIAEAICFSLVNFLIVWLPLKEALASGLGQAYPVVAWVVLIVGFVVVPVVWPFLVVWLLQKAEKGGWITVRAHTAWDDFFGRQRTECWLQVELADGRVIGGRFGRSSFASSWPDPGHLFMEEVWRVLYGGGLARRRRWLFCRTLTGQRRYYFTASRLQASTGLQRCAAG